VITNKFLPLRTALGALALLLLNSAHGAEPGLANALGMPEADGIIQKSGLLLDKIVAVVNDGVVMETELADEISNITRRLREQKTALPSPGVLRSQILERLVIQEIQLQRAERIGLKVSDEQLNSQLARMAEENGLALADLPKALAAQGVEYTLFREDRRKEIILNQLQRRELQERLSVTPRELEQFMERVKRLPDPDTEYNISHILLALPPDATQTQLDEITQRANEIVERARTEEFSKLAVANSNSQTALEGGSLGWRKGPELPTLLQETVVGLKPGEVGKPIVTPNGIHLVKLNEKRGTQADTIEDQVHARHILMKPNELQDDGTVQLKLAGIRERVQKGEDFAAFASSMSEDTGSAVSGGDLEWKGPDAFVPEFQEVVSKLKDNEISEPFQSRFGWHIVQLLGRRKFDITEDSLRERAYSQLVESRANDAVELWLRELRDEAFVEMM
jgi:peptidyl-prolyl cis-trans isomerase SurA